MAINFRLSYLNGSEFTDLFQKTSIKEIKETNQLLKPIEIQVEIPATNDLTQVIQILTTTEMEEAWVEMNLIGNTTQEKIDYNTITQFQIQSNQLIITRLGNKPTNQIQVNLLFYTQGVY